MRRLSRQALLTLALDLSKEIVGHDDPTDNDAWMTVDLTMPQLKILMKLSREGPQPVGALAQLLGVHAPTASGILQRLVRGGYVRRSESTQDRRITLVALTDRGSSVVQQLFAAQQEILTRTYRHLSTSELSTVIGAIELLVKARKSRAAGKARRLGRRVNADAKKPVKHRAS
jgi:DNA-binding MarR family transcriptional regulator